MPEQLDGEHIGAIPEISGLIKHDADAHYLILVIYSISNC